MQFEQLSKVNTGEYGDLPLDLFSYDDGYHAKKAFSTYMPEGVLLHTMMGKTSKRFVATRSVMGTRGLRGAELKEQNGPMRYLFGLHAAGQFQADDLVAKSTDDVAGQANTKLLQFFRATLSMMFPKPGKYRANGVVMMPVASIKKDPGFKAAVSNALQGAHKFSAVTGYDETGAPVYGDWDVLVADTLVLEQPLGSMFNVALDPDSDGPDLNTLQSGKNAFLDWGKGTLDIFVTDVVKDASGNRTIEHVGQMCDSANAGIFVLYDYIRSMVLEPAGLNPTPTKLEEAIMTGFFKDNRKVANRSKLADVNGNIDLTPYIKAAISEMWQSALDLFDETIGLDAESIDNIFITGGPVGWMQPYVLEHFGSHRVFKAMADTVRVDPQRPYAHLMESKDLHLRNAKGGYLFALKMAGRGG